MTTGVVISHPTKQGNIYERAVAVEREGLRLRFLTGFYGAVVPFWLRLPGKISLRYQRALGAVVAKRTHPGINPRSVVIVSSPLHELLKLKLNGLGSFQNWRHDLGAAAWLMKRLPEGFRIFHCFQESCERAIAAAKAQGMHTILEVTSPPIGDREIEVAPGLTEAFCAELRKENERKRRQILKEARLADTVFIQSEFSRRFLQEAGISDRRITKVDLGVDTDIFRPVPRPTESSGALKLLFVGQIGFRKGFDVLCRALAQFPCGVCEVVAVGHVVDEVGRRCLAENPAIDYRGVVPDADLPSLYVENDLLVIPSRSEGGCNVVMEALACGTPCLVSDGAISVIRHRENGWVIPNGDVKALSAILTDLIVSRQQLAGYSAAARRTALNHSWNRFHDNLLAAYSRELKGG